MRTSRFTGFTLNRSVAWKGLIEVILKFLEMHSMWESGSFVSVGCGSSKGLSFCHFLSWKMRSCDISSDSTSQRHSFSGGGFVGLERMS